jgi:Holliday junction resolvase
MSQSHPSPNSAKAAEERIATLLSAHGWEVDRGYPIDNLRADLAASKGAIRYAIEVKTLAESRPDRVIALLSQAILQARVYADRSGMRPLAVVSVREASPSLLRKVEQFHRDYAQGAAIGLVSEAGSRQFIGFALEPLNAEAPRKSGSAIHAKPRKASDLFSDLNQWMLKVLLAPELPEHMLHAPRGSYYSVSELAEAADVSPMSASRFVRRLQEEGFLDDSGGAFQLVRRRELFRRWQSAALRSSPELKMSYLIPATGSRQLKKVVSQIDGCVGLFAAAEMLNLLHVSGVAAHLYVRRLSPAPKGDWPGLLPAAPGEPAQVILKQALAPESLFRGAVQIDGVPVSDVLQIWLDASAHPSRGAEQADFLRQKFLGTLMGSKE